MSQQQQTTAPLIEIMQAPHRPTWAVFADCAGIFDRDSKKKAQTQRPIFREIMMFCAATTAVAKEGQWIPTRNLWAMVSGRIMELPEGLKEKGQFPILTDEEHTFSVAQGCKNFVALTAVEPDAGRWMERCEKKRAEVEGLIEQAYLAKIVRPDTTIVGPGGQPLH